MNKRSYAIAVLIVAVVSVPWAAQRGSPVSGSNQSIDPRSGSRRYSADFEDITIPRMLSFQGTLRDSTGRIVPDTTYSIQFGLYRQASGGSAIWSETQTVRTMTGLFSVLLGSAHRIGPVPDDGSLFLGMKIESDSEVTPRKQIVSAAYAYKADTAQQAYWADSAKLAQRADSLTLPCLLAESSSDALLSVTNTRNDGEVVQIGGGYHEADGPMAVIGGGLVGGCFYASSENAIGLVALGWDDSHEAIYARGHGWATGGWRTPLDGDRSGIAVMGIDRTILASGTGQLRGGRASISLPDGFASSLASGQTARVSLTQRGEPSGVLFARNITASGFEVALKSVPGWGGGSEEFDWIACGTLKEPSDIHVGSADTNRLRHLGAARR